MELKMFLVIAFIAGTYGAVTSDPHRNVTMHDHSHHHRTTPDHDHSHHHRTTPDRGTCNRYRYEQCAKMADSMTLDMCKKIGIQMRCALESHCEVPPEDRRRFMKYCMSSATKEMSLPVSVLVLSFLAIKYITDM